MHLRDWLVIGDAERTEDIASRPAAEGFRRITTEMPPTSDEIRRAEAVFWLHDRLPEGATAVALADARILFVNAVETSTGEIPLPGNLVRINGWPGFLRHPLLELAAPPAVRPMAESFLRQIGWPWRWVADIPGMATPRILARIVNEACLAVGEGVSDPAGIDRAMRLGASYPGGPFEWSRRIGAHRIAGLLDRLSLTDERYIPARHLLETLSAAT